jgi:hypothetical protein
MGGLRPIGSEKLQGMDKIKRIMEIARFNENIPQPINETKSVDYSIQLADGNTYFIVREKSGYIIKKGLNESTTDYMEPIQNRKYFTSYSQAMKKLNLIAKDFNVIYENDEGISLFSEQKKKFKLRLPTTQKSEPTPEPMPAPTPEPMPEPIPEPIPTEDVEGELPPPMDGETGDDMGEVPPMEDDMDNEEDLPPMEDDMDDEEKSSKKDEGTSFKVIQKLTGKLAQKIRKFNSEDEMDPNDVKYIINSILSAIDVDLLDEDDLEEIISRLEGDFDEDEDESEDNTDEDMGDEEMSPMPDDTSDEIDLPQPPEGGEMSEYNELGETMGLSDAINKGVRNAHTYTISDKLKELGEGPKKTAFDDIRMDDNFGKILPDDLFYDETEVEFEDEDLNDRLRRKLRGRPSNSNYQHLTHGTFGESKVDKIISKYFDTTEDELLSKEQKKLKLIESKEKRKEILNKKIKNLSESIQQERAAFKYLEKHPDSKFVGKTNKGNLVFSEGVVQTKITDKGLII